MADKLAITQVVIPSELNAGDSYNISVTVENISTVTQTVRVGALIQSIGMVYSSQKSISAGSSSTFTISGLTMPNADERVYVQAFYWDGANWVEGAAYAKGPYDIKLVTMPRLSIRTYDMEGGVVTGVKVDVGSYSKTSDSQGWAIFDIPAGTYKVFCTKTGYTCSPSYCDVTITVTGDRTLYLYLSPSETATVTFRVYDNEGNTLSNVKVGFSGVGVSQTKYTGTDGRAVFYDIPYNPYNYTCLKTGYESATGTLYVNNPSVTQNVYLTSVAPPQYKMKIGVLDSYYQAIVNATVVADGNTKYSDSDGNVEFLLPEGVYTVTCSKTGYSPVSFQVDLDQDLVDLFVTLAPENVAGKVLVHVNDSAGHGIPGAIVSLAGQTASDPYLFFNIPYGTYTIQVSKTGWATYTGSVTINQPEQIINIVLTGGPGMGSLQGNIRDVAGRGISDVQVAVNGFMATTNAYGWFKYDSLEAKQYAIKCSRPPIYQDYQGTITIAPGENSVNIVMEAVAPGDTVWRHFSNEDFYRVPKNFLTGTAEFACPIYLGTELFERSAKVDDVQVSVTVTPTGGINTPAERRVIVSYIGFQGGKVEEHEIFRAIWQAGQDEAVATVSALKDFFYGLGLNMFTIKIATLPMMWLGGVEFKIKIDEFVLARF